MDRLTAIWQLVLIVLSVMSPPISAQENMDVTLECENVSAKHEQYYNAWIEIKEPWLKIENLSIRLKEEKCFATTSNTKIDGSKYELLAAEKYVKCRWAAAYETFEIRHVITIDRFSGGTIFQMGAGKFKNDIQVNGDKFEFKYACTPTKKIF